MLTRKRFYLHVLTRRVNNVNATPRLRGCRVSFIQVRSTFFIFLSIEVAGL